MRISLLVVGKTTDTRLQALIDDYQQRLGHYVPFELTVIPDLRIGLFQVRVFLHQYGQ